MKRKKVLLGGLAATVLAGVTLTALVREKDKGFKHAKTRGFKKHQREPRISPRFLNKRKG